MSTSYINKIIKAFPNRIRIKKKELASFWNYLKENDYTNKYIYVSHHKCATQYTMRIIREVCELKRWPAIKCDWRKKIGCLTLLFNKFLMIQDYSSDIVDITRIKGRGFHVIRDPRDILVSMYFSHRYVHGAKKDKTAEILRNREILSGMGEQGGLRYLMDHSGYFRRVTDEIGAWDYHRENFYETSYEKIIQDPLKEFEIIFAFLEIKIDSFNLKAILKRNSFEALRKEWAAQYGDTKPSHYRKGEPEDWANHLTGENKEVFKQRYGQLLIRLGYEKDNSW